MSSDLVVITSYFNPHRFKKRYENYLLCRDQVRNAGIHLITVEAAFGSDPYELNGGDILQFRGKDLMWVKERLLAEGIEYVLKKTTYTNIAWIDADTIFSESNWADKTQEKLQHYKVVQCFNHCVQAYSDTTQERGCAIECAIRGIPITNGAPGGAFAARREFLDKVNIYQYAITGGGDTLYVLALCKEVPDRYDDLYRLLHEEVGYVAKWAFPMIAHWYNWAKYAQLHIKPYEVGFVNQEVTFLPHGKQVNRRGTIRTTEMLHFDPYKDIRLNEDSRMFEWASSKVDFHKLVKNYFWQRNDDDL